MSALLATLIAESSLARREFAPRSDAERKSGAWLFLRLDTFELPPADNPPAAARSSRDT